MLSLTLKQEENVLMYNSKDGKLIGVITCGTTGGKKPASMQFKMNRDFVIVREALVRQTTTDISVCPAELLKKFGNPIKH